MQNIVNIRKLKEFATKDLPIGLPLREVLLAEPDEVEASEILSRLPIYIRLVSLKPSQPA